jgi:hypothetical protein
MEMNFLSPVVAAFTTLLVGFIWYHPNFLGTLWIQEAGLTKDKSQKGNMFKIFGLTFVFSIFIGIIMQSLTIHQFGALGMIIGAGIYAEIYPFLKNTVLSWADIGKVGVADVLGVSHWMVAIVFTFVVLFLFKWFEKKKL